MLFCPRPLIPAGAELGQAQSKQGLGQTRLNYTLNELPNTASTLLTNQPSTMGRLGCGWFQNVRKANTIQLNQVHGIELAKCKSNFFSETSSRAYLMTSSISSANKQSCFLTSNSWKQLKRTLISSTSRHVASCTSSKSTSAQGSTFAILVSQVHLQIHQD